MRNFNFVVCFRWSDKRSFSILSKTKAICPKDCGLISRLVGVGRKEKLKFSDGRERQATSRLREVLSSSKNPTHMAGGFFRAERGIWENSARIFLLIAVIRPEQNF